MLEMDSIISRRRRANIILHFAIWGLAFCLPLIASLLVWGNVAWHGYINYVIAPMVFMGLYYLNYCYLVDKLLVDRKITMFILVNLLAIIVGISIEHLWRATFEVSVPDVDMDNYADFAMLLALPMIAINFMAMALVILLSLAIKSINNWYTSQAEKQALERERTEAEIQNLKNQLNPHFLFNTLNNIYVLAGVNPEQAQYAIHSLSSLLRYVLYDNSQQMIPLEKELAFTRNYIELMSLRLSPQQTSLEVHITDCTEGCTIAPLLFMSLIENAFKHGVSPTKKSFIDIDIELRGDDRNLLDCTVSNSRFPKSANDKSGSGIGLENLRRRLELIYPSRHTIEITETETLFSVHLKITLARDCGEQQ